MHMLAEQLYLRRCAPLQCLLVCLSGPLYKTGQYVCYQLVSVNQFVHCCSVLVYFVWHVLWNTRTNFLVWHVFV